MPCLNNTFDNFMAATLNFPHDFSRYALIFCHIHVNMDAALAVLEHWELGFQEKCFLSARIVSWHQ
jgi:hypothetical protein